MKRLGTVLLRYMYVKGLSLDGVSDEIETQWDRPRA